MNKMDYQRPFTSLRKQIEHEKLLIEKELIHKKIEK